MAVYSGSFETSEGWQSFSIGLGVWVTVTQGNTTTCRTGNYGYELGPGYSSGNIIYIISNSSASNANIAFSVWGMVGLDGSVDVIFSAAELVGGTYYFTDPAIAEYRLDGFSDASWRQKITPTTFVAADSLGGKDLAIRVQEGPATFGMYIDDWQITVESTTNTHCKDNGVWKPADKFVKDNGIWKPAATTVRHDGIWKDV